jgi:hypothetical protein
MSDGDTITQAAVVILLLALAIPALSTAHATAGTPIAYEETAVVSYSTGYAVNESATQERFGETVTVTVDGGGTTLTAGEDYRWDADAGELTWLNSSATASGESATLEYRAYQRTAETQAAWSLLAPFMGVFGLFGFYAAVRALLRIVDQAFEGVDL